MPCFKCPNKRCTYSGHLSNQIVGKCFKCKLNNLIVKKTKAGNYFVGCAGFPACKTSGFFNEKIKSITILDEEC